MKIKSLVLAISTVLCTAAVWADNKVTTDASGNNNTINATQQGGDGNTTIITQVSDNNQSTTSQTGNNNTASVNQHNYNDGWLGEVSNNGTGLAAINQTGDNNFATIDQGNSTYQAAYGYLGSQSTATINQLSSSNSVANIIQYYQLGTNLAAINQAGDTNTANITQSYGAGDSASISQDGSGNTATITQDTDPGNTGNTASITQTDAGNQATINQQSNNSTALSLIHI